MGRHSHTPSRPAERSVTAEEEPGRWWDADRWDGARLFGVAFLTVCYGALLVAAFRLGQVIL